MVIDIKSIKNAIKIKCDTLIPSQFKYELLKKLEAQYTLKTDAQEDFHDAEKIKLTDEDRGAYLKFYEENHFKYSFENFLELVTFPVGTADLFSKENKKIASIDFMPDGDDNLIWIDICDRNNQIDLFDLLNELIEKYCRK